MEPKAKTLRQYQEKLVYAVCRTTDDVLVEQPTGSGKTVEIVTLVAMHLGQRFTHAVISAPQEQIEQGFVKRDYNVVAFLERHGVAVPSIQVPNKPVHKALIRAARESGNLGSVKRIVQYVRESGSQNHAWACTHAALNRLTPKDLPADLTGKARYLQVVYVPDPGGESAFVVTAYDLTPNAKRAYRRRQRRKKK
jgi:Rad3-related DNA helicase